MFSDDRKFPNIFSQLVLTSFLSHAAFEFDGFSLENCRSMVALKDDRKSGRLSTYQFNLLRESLRRWCKLFKDHKNSDHRVDFTRLGEALVSAKMADISLVVRQMLVQRFGEERSKRKINALVDKWNDPSRLKHSSCAASSWSISYECGRRTRTGCRLRWTSF